MKARLILICSIGLNLALLAVLAHVFKRTHAPVVSAAPATPTNVMRKVRGPLPLRPVATEPRTVEVEAAFRWASVESGDYPTYVANLRAIGCPESTVRDILKADVDDLYAGKVRALVDSVNHRFWSIFTDKEAGEKLINTKHDELKEMSRQKDGLLEKLLGGSIPEDKEESEAAFLEVRRAQLAFLSPEKQRQFALVEQEFVKLRGEAGQGFSNKTLTKEERDAKSNDYKAAFEKARRELLTPAEIAELELRKSADGTIYPLEKFGTEEEMRKLTAMITETTKASPALNPKDPGYNAKLAAQQKETRDQIDQQAREILGAERFDAYQRSKDRRFREIDEVGNRYQLPAETMKEVYEMRLQSEEAVRKVSQNKLLDDDQREESLNAIRVATETSMRQTLGPAAFKTYRRHSTDWLTPPVK